MILDVWQALRPSSPPAAITQRPCDGDPSHLHRLLRVERHDRATSDDLWDYTQDVRYAEVQPDLLAYLLPVCLQAWQDDLLGRPGYGGFVEEFYPMLADRGVFDGHLTPAQTAAVSAFMRQSILDEIDDQRGLSYAGMRARPYRWIRALTTHGVLLSDIGDLWTVWWALGTSGRAVAAVQYVSALMYPANANPIFAPWTRTGGGGPPCLWDFAGHLYSHRWQDRNVGFLRQALTVRAVSDLLGRAADVLAGAPEHHAAARMLSELPRCRELLATRCRDLPTLLARTQEAETLLQWPDGLSS